MQSNTSTRELESFAKDKGMKVVVRTIRGRNEDRRTSVYFVLEQDGVTFDPPKRIGGNIREAELWIMRNKPSMAPKKSMVGKACMSRGCSGRYRQHPEDEDYVQCKSCFYVMAKMQVPGEVLVGAILNNQ